MPVERAIKDEKFLKDALVTIKPIKFPTYKREIVNYLKTTNQEKDKDNQENILYFFVIFLDFVLFVAGAVARLSYAKPEPVTG